MTRPSRAKIAGIGRGVPSKVLTNADLERRVDTSDEWITERSGIKERHILEQGRFSSDLAVDAARMALQQAGIEAEQLDAIILGTVTPDMQMPATAAFVQDKLGIRNHCPAFDLSAACAGFLYGLTLADALIRASGYERVLVIGVEVLSRVLDWTDRSTCVLFGDGAGAAVVVATDEDRGILGARICTDGTQAPHLQIPGGGSRHPTSEATVAEKLHTVHMNGKKIFTNAVRNMSSASAGLLEDLGIPSDEVTTVFAHQANMRIIEGVSQRMGIPMERFFNNIDRYGNTSSASIPTALSEAVEKGRVKPGDLLLLTALGAGVSWGSVLVRW